MIVGAPAWVPSEQPGMMGADAGASGRVMADGGRHAQHDARSLAQRRIPAGGRRRPGVLASAGWPGRSRLSSASGRRVRDETIMARGELVAEVAGRVITAALVSSRGREIR